MLKRSGFDELFREVSYIYSFLGLRQNLVLDKLEIMSSEDREHQSLCDWIVTFIQNSFESVSLTDKRSPSVELLSSIGFDHRSSAAETIMARARDTQHHIDLCEVSEIFIRDQFKYKVSPSSVTCKFPFRSNLKNTWFRLSIFTSDVEIVGSSECHVGLINLVTIESHAYSILRTELGNSLSKDDQNDVLFHGTDHQIACDILFRGIDLCQGRQKRDLIEGPVSTMTTNESTGEFVFSPKPSSYQMCLISDSFADIFRQSPHSILFFDIC